MCALLDEDGRVCGQRWPTARALPAHERRTHFGTHGAPNGSRQVWWSQISAFGAVRPTPASRQLPSTCPLQKNIPDVLFIILDVASAGRGDSPAKRFATEGEPEDREGKRKNNMQQPEGTKDDVTMGGTSSGSKGAPNKSANKITDVILHNAVLKTLCVLSQQVREVRGAVLMCWMIKQEALEYKRPKEQLRAGMQGQRDAAADAQGSRRSRAYCKRCRREGARWDRPTRQEWPTSRKPGSICSRRGAFDMVPHCKLAKVYDPALCGLELVVSVTEHREYFRGALGQT